MELKFAFTLLALRCVNFFYSKRVKAVETIQRDFAARFFVGKNYGRGIGVGRASLLAQFSASASRAAFQSA